MAKSKNSKPTSSDSAEATGSENRVVPPSPSLEQAELEHKKPTVTISEAALHDLVRQMQFVTRTMNAFSNEQAAWRQRMQQELAGQRTYIDSTVLKLQASSK